MSDKGKLNISKAHKSPRPYSRKKIVQLTKLNVVINGNTMKIILKRIARKDAYTIGNLFVNREFVCNTLEDKDRGLTSQMSLEEIKAKKVYGETAIPTGVYKLNMNTVSPKFKDRSWAIPYKGILPRLENVKGFEGVLIHVGNKPQDTLGCILVGENKVKGQVINSTASFNKLMKLLLQANIDREDIELTVE